MLRLKNLFAGRADGECEGRPVRERITYDKLFWLFIIGSVLGVPLEGVWCYFKWGHWETHVVTIWAPLCIIYGLGAVGCYVGSILLEKKNIVWRFLAFAAVGTAVELICGAVLEFGLGMYAWDYSDRFLNFRGYVSLFMTFIWGVLGIVFGLAVPTLEKMLDKMQGRAWRISCAVLSAVLAADFIVTAMCLVRWSDRHNGEVEQRHIIHTWIDERYNDEMMQQRYIEWRFFE